MKMLWHNGEGRDWYWLVGKVRDKWDFLVFWFRKWALTWIDFNVKLLEEYEGHWWEIIKILISDVIFFLMVFYMIGASTVLWPVINHSGFFLLGCVSCNLLFNDNDVETLYKVWLRGWPKGSNILENSIVIAEHSVLESIWLYRSTVLLLQRGKVKIFVVLVLILGLQLSGCQSSTL